MYGGGRCVVLVLRWVDLYPVPVLPLLAFCLSVFVVVVRVLHFLLGVCLFLLFRFLSCLSGFPVCCLPVDCDLVSVVFQCLLGGRALVVLVRALMF